MVGYIKSDVIVVICDGFFFVFFLSIEWNSMRLSDREPQKLTKTVRETVLSGGMVSCGVVSCGMVSCGVVSCGVVGCGHFFPIPSLSPIFFGSKT